MCRRGTIYLVTVATVAAVAAVVTVAAVAMSTPLFSGRSQFRSSMSSHALNVDDALS